MSNDENMINQTGQENNQTGTLIEVDLDKEMRKSFLDYSMSVITQRALPDGCVFYCTDLCFL